MSTQPHILITGADGLIGHQLCKQLTADGCKISHLDIRRPKVDPGYGDICHYPNLTQLINTVDGIVHLAAISRVIWGEQMPEKCWEVNVDGTQKLLQVIWQSAHKPWFLYASSREVYGEQIDLPITEETTRQAVNQYARSKIAAEDLVSQYQNMGLTTSIMRFSNVYGATDDHVDRVLPAFCRAAHLGKPLYIEGPDNVFDFTHVEDVVTGIIAATHHLQHARCLPPIHLTTGKGTTLLEAAQLAINASGNHCELIFKTPRNFDVARFIGDPAKAKYLLNWQARILPATGIPRFVQDFTNLATRQTFLQKETITV